MCGPSALVGDLGLAGSLTSGMQLRGVTKGCSVEDAIGHGGKLFVSLDGCSLIATIVQLWNRWGRFMRSSGC